jgi:4-aminobutyrate aminotransferase-like enzyme
VSRGSDRACSTTARFRGLRARGVVDRHFGAHRNILEIRPLLVFSKANADQLVAALERGLDAI